MDEGVTFSVIIENQRKIIQELIERNADLTARVQINDNQSVVITDLLSKNIMLTSKLQIAYTQIKQLESINNTTVKPTKRISAFKQARSETK